MRKSPQMRPRLIVSVFSTISWFHEQRLHFSASSVAEVVRAVEPLLDATSEQLKVVERRWRDYWKGRHAPVESVIARAEKVCPSSRAVIESLLWDALRFDRCARSTAVALIGRTNKAGDELLTRMLALSEASKDSQRRWLRNRCKLLIRKGTLEGLAVITVCMRVAAEAGVIMEVLALAYWCRWCLFVLAPWLFEHGILYGLAEYYQNHVLPKCLPEPYSVSFCARHFLDSAAGLAVGLEKEALLLGRDLSAEEIADRILAIEAL